MLDSGATPSLATASRRYRRAVISMAGLHAGLEHDPIRAGRARRVEQGVDGQLLGRCARALEPELDEARKFLAGGEARVQRQPAAVRPVVLAFAQRAKVARTQHDEHLVLGLGGDGAEAHAKPRQSEVAQQARVQLEGTIVERVGIELDLLHTVRGDFVDPHRLVVVHPLVQERHLEGKLGGAPEGLVRLVADIPVLIVVQALQLLGQSCAGLLIGAVGELLGAVRDVGEIERLRARRSRNCTKLERM